MVSGYNDADEATSRRVEGPTPKGCAYSIGYFSHDGRSVPQRFANQLAVLRAGGPLYGGSYGDRPA
jgi:hypothetical protein